MRFRRILAALTGVLLTLPVTVLPPAAASAAADVPCPAVSPPVSRPPRPPVPEPDPADRRIGGDALATAGLAVPPGATRPPAVTATSWMVADLDSGAVLGGCGPHEYGVPASTQKLLLVATVLPKLDPEQVVTVNRKDLDFERGSSAVGLVLDGRYPVRTLWLGLLLNSGNDAANVLARLGGGDAGVAGTVAAMNAEAHQLGARQTHAATPSGLDGPGQVTSPYDLALITRACFDNEDFRSYDAARTAQMPPQPAGAKNGFQIQNENQLLFHYRGGIGGKTGFTTLARHSYVGIAERGGRRLVVTLLGAEARPLRGWQQGAALLDWGFAQPTDASVGRLVAPGELDATPGPAASRPGAARSLDRVGRPGGAGLVGWPVLAGTAALLGVVALLLLVLAVRSRPRHVGRRRAR
ncbi:D-alanyl-D-alanine carboxypeptidase family protein [Plantactinospora sp. KBS50]|uniref:D-alanyl-D-alanine carboxypeptidase family protein n=1 Tax=Plantactinospora sp. KBS50 TaxID=2024580 RepID=UPI000BAAA110|nr:serine hydrolase [Plantactinospora sp. KBS50]ASW55240.1 D-alanyl-D-alanine carboxypeptidase [Plantactinospora sp. KBS50]